MSTKLTVVEDHEIVRELLVRMLSSHDDFKVSASAGSIADARTVVESSRPDVVLLDIVLPDGSGIEYARELKAHYPDSKILFLTAFDQEDTLLAAINTGAEGYVVKSSSCDRLIDAIKAVVSGQHVFDPAITAPIIERFARIHSTYGSSDISQLKRLSSREREIASLASNGLTNKEIAKATGVSVNTVKTHLRRIFQHLEVTSRRELLQKSVSGIN